MIDWCRAYYNEKDAKILAEWKQEMELHKNTLNAWTVDSYLTSYRTGRGQDADNSNVIYI